jgi:hypothetical protein
VTTFRVFVGKSGWRLVEADTEKDALAKVPGGTKATPVKARVTA